MYKYTYYITDEDGLVRYNWQKRKHELIIPAKRVTGGSVIFDFDDGKFWVHNDCVYISNSHFTYLFDIKTNKMYGVSNRRTKNLFVADNHFLFYCMDDNVTGAIELENIKLSELSYGLPRDGLSTAKMLTNRALCCYGTVRSEYCIAPDHRRIERDSRRIKQNHR